MTRRLLAIRLIVLLTAILGLNYAIWRWLFSINRDAWWIGYRGFQPTQSEVPVGTAEQPHEGAA